MLHRGLLEPKLGFRVSQWHLASLRLGGARVRSLQKLFVLVLYLTGAELSTWSHRAQMHVVQWFHFAQFSSSLNHQLVCDLLGHSAMSDVLQVEHFGEAFQPPRYPNTSPLPAPGIEALSLISPLL